MKETHETVLQDWGGITDFKHKSLAILGWNYINFEYKCLAKVGWNYELRIQMSWETGVELQNLNTNPQYLSINFKQNITIITWHCHWWSSRVST